MTKNKHDVDLARVRVELADTIDAARDEDITLIHYNAVTGEAWRISPDGTIEPYELRDETDWARINALSEDEIEVMAAVDDSLPADWFDDIEIVPRRGGKMLNGTR